MKKLPIAFIYTVFVSVFWIILLFSLKNCRNQEEEKTEYKQQPPVSGIVTNLQAKTEETPENPILPIRIDTLRKDSIIYLFHKVDTDAIIADYIKKRSYDIILFDDNKIGRLEITPTIQYNKIDSIPFVFTPIHKTTIIRERNQLLVPFVSIGFTNGYGANLGGGFFFKNVGVEYLYQIPTNEHSFGLKYKFEF